MHQCLADILVPNMIACYLQLAESTAFLKFRNPYHSTEMRSHLVFILTTVQVVRSVYFLLAYFKNNLPFVTPSRTRTLRTLLYMVIYLAGFRVQVTTNEHLRFCKQVHSTGYRPP